MSKMKNSPLSHHRNTNSSSSTSNIGSHSTNTSNITVKKWEVINYMLIFFFMMICHEIVLEAALTSFNQLEFLTAIIPLFQFGFCTIHHIHERSLSNMFKILEINSSLFIIKILLFGVTGLVAQSLMYASYPTKVAFKSAKLIHTIIVLTFLFLVRRRRSMVTWIILLLPYYILVLQGIAIIVAINWATVSFYCFRCIISSWRGFRRCCQLYSENGTWKWSICTK